MKIVFLFLLYVPLLLCGTVRTVSLDGSQQHSTIQEAINASADNDTIFVYPGRYTENVITVSKTIYIKGQYNPNNSDSLQQTIIDGNRTGSCIVVTDTSDVVIENLFLTNGSGYRLFPRSDESGGGIYCYLSSIRVVNCLIRDNDSTDSGGACFYMSDVFLSGTTFTYNHSWNGSAVTFPNSTISFDPINLCSIYLNFGTRGNDLNVLSGTEVFLDKATLSYIDDEFIICNYTAGFTFSCQQAAIVQIPADLYVSPWGNDTNDGLTPQTPLKTIALAMILIQADSLNHRTVHLAEGVYSPSLNGQYFPLNLRSYVTIEGASETGTIIDGDSKYFAAYGQNGEKYAGLRNLTIQHCGSEAESGVIYINTRYLIDDITIIQRPLYSLENITIRDCVIPQNTPNADFQFMHVIRSGFAIKAYLKNIKILNCNGSNAINISGGNTYAEDILIDNYSYGNMQTSGNPLVVNRNSALDFPESPNYFINIRITNCIANDDPTMSSAMFLLSYFISGTQVPFENYLINSTISDNVCRLYVGGAVNLHENGRLTMINSIIYHNRPYDIMLNAPNNYPARLRVLNSIVGDDTLNAWGGIHSFGANNVLEWYGNNIIGNPLFLGTGYSNPYYLSSTSPCINAGTTDLSMFNLPVDFIYPATDLAGNPRIYNNQVDMGAYEWCGVSNQDYTTPLSDTQLTLLNYPNPFKDKTTLSYILSEKQPVQLAIYNLKGQNVFSLQDAPHQKGLNNITWNGKDEKGKTVSSGVYFYKLNTPEKSIIKKCLLLK